MTEEKHAIQLIFRAFCSRCGQPLQIASAPESYDPVNGVDIKINLCEYCLDYERDYAYNRGREDGYRKGSNEAYNYGYWEGYENGRSRCKH